jgi:ATP-dependent RNA helicase SUPV3L1/SUV3
LPTSIYFFLQLIADNLEEIRLPLRDRYQFVTAPVSTRSDGSMELIKKLARKFSQKKICTLDELIDLPTNPPTSSSGLKALEESHKQIMLYMWLR